MHTSALIPVLAVCLQSILIVVAEDIPEECKSLTYCTVKPKNYPEEKFNQMYKGLKILIEPPPAPEVAFDNRGSIPGEEDDCVVHVSVDPVYIVRESLDKPWRTVIQAPGVDYVQKVRIEKCVTIDAPCFSAFLRPEVSTYFTTYCQQKYIYYNFLVEKGKDSTETETVRAELPACCSCRYKPTNESM